jgi:L-amino acid N-acyltransferase YncA
MNSEEVVRPLEAEISIMIAETSARRKGISSQIVEFMKKEIKEGEISSKMVATINEDNEASINFFMKMGFVERKRMSYFKQIEYCLNL